MKTDITIGEKYHPAMKIESQEEADAYFEECVAHTMSHGKTRQEAEVIERANLCYFAGYYDSETRERVERLFRCANPFFGKFAVLETGIRLGREMTRNTEDRTEES